MKYDEEIRLFHIFKEIMQSIFKASYRISVLYPHFMDSQNSWVWKGPLLIIQKCNSTLIKQGQPQKVAACPILFWIPLRMETPQPLWITHPTVQPLWQQKCFCCFSCCFVWLLIWLVVFVALVVFVVVSDGISSVSVCAYCLLSCMVTIEKSGSTFYTPCPSIKKRWNSQFSKLFQLSHFLVWQIFQSL